MHRLTLRARSPAHRDFHYRHERAISKASPPLESADEYRGCSTIQPPGLLTANSVQTIVVDGLFNWLQHHAISGEMTPPSGTGACDMQSTESGSDAVSAHAVPQSGPCAEEPSVEDVPRLTDRTQFTITAEPSPVPSSSASIKTTNYPPLSHLRSPASSTLQRRQPPGAKSHHSGTLVRYLG